ncbi:subtilase-type protease inhibitor [Streptomyces sp. SP18CS02]|uniref:subtilase-type protease inhibitor n=1 Tax=Streptomyces sp. SP18CS02 TaxID=3002531 RepID=UPI002E78E601|nr:subtilase-type protease inhibitor [Streptomyces sp. SP18CS02]MEE1757472.1 subtilase-type protease inhibitor [Streptomyces sp. SP18CS02]
MRTLARRAVVCGLAAAAALSPLAAAEAATPEPRLYAPTALVLTVAQGEDAATASPMRAVTLTCTPTPGGTHPSAQRACSELRAVQGRFDALSGDNQRSCVKIYDPVVVTAQGIWEGRRVDFERTFSNSCVMQSENANVYSF